MYTMSKDVSHLCDFSSSLQTRGALRAVLAADGGWCWLQALGEVDFWLQLLFCHVAGCVCPKSPRGEDCWNPACGVCLLQPGCSCRCWSGLGGMPGTSGNVAAAHQGLHPKPTNVVDGLPLSHQPNPATEETAGKTPIYLNEMRIRPSETSFQFIS